MQCFELRRLKGVHLRVNLIHLRVLMWTVSQPGPEPEKEAVVNKHKHPYNSSISLISFSAFIEN